MGREVTCNLPGFLERVTASTSLGHEKLEVTLPSSGHDTVETSWAILLYMYTNLTEICFESRDATGKVSVKYAEIQGEKDPGTAAPKTVGDDARALYKSNTAVISITDSHYRELDAATTLEGTLWPGIDVALCASESHCGLVYRRNFMSPREAALIKDTLRHIMSTRAASNGPQTIRDVTISHEDIEKISAWNSLPLVTAEALVHEEISRTVAARPDAMAIDSWDCRMTYRDLENASDILAGHLRRMGAGPGDWVLLCFTKSRWAIISMLAVLKAGAAFTPVDPRFPELRVRQILNTTTSKHALVCAEDTAALLRRSSAALQVIDVSSVEYGLPVERGNLEAPRITPRSPAIGLFTSGSTGTPKCIIAPHSAVITGARGFGDYVGADGDTRFLQFASYTFDMSYADIITALLYGSCLCIPSEDERMGGVQDYIQRVRPTWANLTPTVARMLDPAMSPSIKKLLLAGELVKEADVEGWIKAGVEVYNVYGPAENVIICTVGRISLGRASIVGSGKNTRTWVVDVEKGRLVPIGAVGELVLEGPQVAPGYLRDPERTEKSFLSGLEYIPAIGTLTSESRRFYRTGDLVRQSLDGTLECLGRIDAQVKLGGQRVELSDIESHIELTRSALLLPKAGPLANHLTAVLEVSVSEGSDLSSLTRLDRKTVTEVRASLAERLPAYMIPSVWLGIGKLPASTSNKLDRKSLVGKVESLSREDVSQLTRDDTSPKVESIELDTQQTLLRDVCSQVLNLPLEQIVMSQSFFGLGGDSITAMQVTSMLRRVGSKTLAVRHLLTCPSLLNAAAQMEDLRLAQTAQPTLQPATQFPLSPMQQFFVETALPSSAWHHYNQNVLLEVTQHREPQEIEQAISGVLSRHPMLRARFKVLPSGSWVQCIVPEADAKFRLEHYKDVHLQEERSRIMMNARKGLNLFDGPLLRAQLFEGDGTTKTSLFIVVHHIVVDLVSWRVIVEELESSLTKVGDSTQGTDTLLASSNQSLPFSSWAQLQWQVSQRLQPTQILPALPHVPDSDISFWGISPSQNVYLDVKELRMTLDPSVTQSLLFDCHRALRTEPVDVLIASILVSLKRAFPQRQPPPIFNEGHGREPWDDALDISRTVGWFTTVTPVYAEVDADHVVDVVRRVKDFRKATPSRGFNYFSSKYLTKEGKSAFKNHLPAEILFNYEGRYQSLEKEDALLKPDSWQAGEELADMGPQLQRFCLFELSASILSDGRLHFTSAYNSRAHHQDKISLWLGKLLPEVIQETIKSLVETQPQLTLNDVDRRDITDYSEVKTLTDLITRTPAIRGIEDIESVNYGSPMQNSLALSQSKANSDAYEIDFTWEVSANDNVGISSPINPERLAMAWRETTAVHAALRTVFFEASTTTGSEILHQVVLRSYDPCCISLQAKDRQDALDILAKFPSYREQGLFPDMRPPHRLIICSTANGQCFIRFQINHVVFDGMSETSLKSTLAKMYRAFELNEQRTQTGRAPFADFIKYIREPERRAKSIDYWKSYLSNSKPCIFPTLTDTTMSTSSDDKSSRRGSVDVPLSINLPQLRQAASKLEVTLPTIIHLAWALVLRLYTGEHSVLFGYLSSGRDAPIDGIEDAVGPFLAMLICSVDFSQDATTSMSDILKRIQLASAKSMSNQACSLAEIQSAVNLPGNPLLFNSGITFATRLSREVQMASKSPLVFETISEQDPTEFDMSLFVDLDDYESTIAIHLDYLESALSSTHALNVAASIDHMLTELIRDPYRHPDELFSISKHDLNTLWDWNGPLISPLNKCAHDIFAERVLAYPDREAIYSWDGIMTYKQLDAVSTRLGKHLVELGVGPEKMVPVCFEKSMWAVVTILAIIKAGGCFVLLDPAHPTSRLWSLIEELDSSVLVCSPLTNESKKFEEVISKEKRSISVVKVDPAYVESLPPFSVPPGTAISDVQPENLVYAVFTSGTTGKPKGTLITHCALATGLKEHADATGMGMMGPKTRSLQFASFSFDAAIGDVFTTIEVGGCLCILSEEQRSPADTTAFIAQSKANWTGITPSFASLLDPAAVPTLKAVCLAGEPLPASQVDAWVDNVSLINMYGPTECTIACVANSNVTRQTGASNIGRGYRATTWIVDENDHHRLRPVGTIGELLIEGPVLARGYLNRPEKTAEVFIDSPLWLQSRRPDSKLYKTGDLVRYNSDGTINFIGRKDTQIKINGQRVEVGEIESVLSSNIERSEATIIVDLLKRSDKGENDLLVAFICASSKSGDPEERQATSTDIISTSESSLVKFRSLVAKILHPQSSIATLPRYMIPQAYIPLDKIPLSVSGKTDRRALQTASAQLSRSELVAFTSGISSAVEDNLETDAQALLAKLWKKVLGIEVQGKQSNFIHLGGDSLNAMALRAEVLRAGFKLSVAEIFANPDLADMAEVLVSTPSSTESSTPLDSSAPSTPPDLLPEVKPFSLLSTIELHPTAEFLNDISRECGILPEQVDDVFPCTPMQEGLMALSSSKSREGAYALHAAFKLPADINIVEFIRAWEATVMEYPICRSRIVPRPQGSLVVVTHIAPDVYRESWGDLKDHLAQQRRMTFSYGSPLFRLGIFHEKEQDSKYLVINAHHAVYDGWSIKLIWESALAYYANKTIPVEQSPSFQTFVRELSLQSHSTSEVYWGKTLTEQDQDGFKFPVVPGSHSPSASASKTFSFQYDSKATRSLGVTSSELLNATWAITLSQYSASPSIAFGVTLSGRDIPLLGADRIVGPTITTVPRQINILKEQSIPDFLRYVRQTAAEALPHQHLGLQRIAGISPVTRKACDFTSLLIVTPSSVISSSSMEQIGIAPVPIEAADFHPYPLALECRPENGTLEIEVAFDPECIDSLTVERMMQQFNHVLQHINQSTAAESVESLFTKVSPSHLETMIGWNTKTQDIPTPTRSDLVHQLIVNKARTQPSSPAIEARGETLTYKELDQLSESLSSQILGARAKSLDSPFVGLYMDKSPIALVSMLAILKSGMAFMPLSPSQPIARIQSLLEAAGAKLVLTSPDRLKSLSDSLPECSILPVDSKTLGQNSVGAKSDTVVYNSSSPAYLLYTSGTTGKPKGVIIGHEAWLNAITAQAGFFSLSNRTRMLQFSSFTFDVSLFEIFCTLASGGCVCIPSETERMNDLAGFIQSMNINSLSLTPTVARLLMPDEMDNVDLVVFAGEALTQADIDSWVRPGRRLVNAYGPTEACIYATVREISDDGVVKKATNIGKPLGTDAWVVNPLTDTLCPIGGVGELCIGGSQLAQGYHGDPETTKKAFTDHILAGVPNMEHRPRLYRTGDLVRFESDGTIDFLGRRDAQVKLRGQRISLAEIEYHVQNCMKPDAKFRHATVQLYKQGASGMSSVAAEPSLVAFLVMDIPFDQRVGDVGYTYMSTSKDSEVSSTATDLRKKLRNVLPDYMVPSIFVALERLPTNASGKLDRQFIEQCLQGVGPLSRAQAPTNSTPLTPEQTVMKEWWARVLRVDPESISVDSDFFAFGGNSLSGIKLVSLARSCGKTLSYEKVLLNPVLSDMAACVTTTDAGSEVDVRSARRMKPFGLLSDSDAKIVFEDTLPVYEIKPQDVEDIYPTTPFQEAAIALAARDRNIYILILTMEIPIADLAQLKLSWASAFAEFEILRTRIVPSPRHDGAYQVVMKNRDLTWNEMPSVQAFVDHVYDSQDYGQPLVRIGLVKPTDDDKSRNTVTVLFSASHAAYDGYSLSIMWPRLFPTSSPITVASGLPKPTPFKEFIRYQTSLDVEKANTFWRTRLEGLSSTLFPSPASPVPTHHVTALRQSVHEKFTMPSGKPSVFGATSAVVAQAAWALTVSHFTANPDVVFRVILTGRDVAASDVPGIETVAGPTATIVPCRTIIDYDDDGTVAGLISGLQRDKLEAGRFAHVGLERISRLSDDCRRACVMMSNFNFNFNPGDGDGDAGEKKETSDPAGAGAGAGAGGPYYKPAMVVGDDGFSANCLMAELTPVAGTDDLLVAVNYDPAYVSAAQAPEITGKFVEILGRLFAADGSTRVRDVSTMSERPWVQTRSERRDDDDLAPTNDDTMPLSPTEELLADAWRKVLGIDNENTITTRISRGTDFFALGGNSLAAMRVGAELRRVGYSLRVPQMFKNPTLTGMAAVLRPSLSFLPSSSGGKTYSKR